MPYRVYVNISGESKLSIYTMDLETGDMTLQEDVALSGGPGPLAVDPEHKHLYLGLRSTRELVSFDIDRATGKLSQTGSAALDADPCYISTDRRGRYLLSAYYGAGKVTVHPIAADGSLAEAAQQTISTSEHAHCIQTDASNRFVFVPHTVPPNAIYQFLFDEDTGMLSANAVPKAQPKDPDGPRHYCFHPTKDIVYASNEQGSSTTAYRFDTTSGTLSPFQTLSTLPKGFEGDNTCAQIHIAPSGRSLYVSNRGHDSIACFSIDDQTGELTSQGQQPTEETPRVFNVDPQGRFLLAAGQGSGKLATYRIVPESGALEPLSVYVVGDRPMWIHVEDSSD